MRVFLDANVLFSAALGGESFALLWALAGRGAVELVTSAYCYVEARTNLERKSPGAAVRLAERMAAVSIVGPGGVHLEWAAGMLPPKDAEVLAAARGAGAAVLLTGDRRHFGALMAQSDLAPRVRTVRDFLLAGPPPAAHHRRGELAHRRPG